MKLTELIEKRIDENVASYDLGTLESYKYLIEMIAIEYHKKQLNLCGVSNRRELLIATFKDLDLEYIQGFDDEEWLANKVIEVINCC